MPSLRQQLQARASTRFLDGELFQKCLQLACISNGVYRQLCVEFCVSRQLG